MRLFIDLARNQHAALFSYDLKLSHDVNAIAKQIKAIHNHIAQMHPDAKFQTVLVQGFRLTFYFDRTLNRFDHAREPSDQIIARCVGNAALAALRNLITARDVLKSEIVPAFSSQ